MNALLLEVYAEELLQQTFCSGACCYHTAFSLSCLVQ